MSWDFNKSIVVTGVGLRSCLGNLEETWQSLNEGKTGIKLRQPFRELSPYPLGMIENLPLSLSALVAPVIREALANAYLVTPLKECGVVIGSSRGCQGEWEVLLKSKISHNWEQMFPHQAATLAAREIGTFGPVIAPMNACSTGIWAIAQAYQLINQGLCEQVIAGGIETPITALTITGFQQMGALASRGCYPFDHRREGLVLAEGSAVLVLESLESAEQRGVTPYAEIRGFGLTCDAHHITTPEPTGKEVIKAISDCLRRSELSLEEIDLIYTHGTGTLLNDQREAAIIQSIFKSNVPVTSIKGAIGHTLGASGAISVALSLLSIRDQVIPGCVGLESPAFALNLIRETVSAKLEKILCLSFGFGGQNAVLVIAA